MSAENDARLAEAKSLPIKEIADRLGLNELKRAGREWVGPCPKCGGSDRFGINADRGVYNCRSCGGGDGISLVSLVLGLEFKDALSWLVGDITASLDPEEARRRKERADRQARERARAASNERNKAINLAREIWNQGRPAENTMVRRYLKLRGFSKKWLPELPECLRYHPKLRYTVWSDGAWEAIHEGPAMLAMVQEPSGALIGVHRTWIDLETPSGKAAIEHGGKAQPAKKMLGSKKGGSIRLSGYSEDRSVLVVGEGIETTLSAMVAADIPDCDYWAGVDLGNMSGRRLPVENPKTGKSSTRMSDVPDLSDRESFVPPPWIERLIFIQDGDSAPGQTRAKLIAGLMRAKAHVPSLTAQIVHAGKGVDLNDVLRGKSAENEGVA